MDVQSRIELAAGALYEAAADDQLWPRALDACSEVVGSAETHYFVVDRRANALRFGSMGTHYPEAASAEYNAYYGGIDPQIAPAVEQPGKLIHCCEVFDSDFIRRSEFHNDYLFRWGVPFMTGMMMYEAGGMAGFAAFARRDDQGPMPREAAVLAEHICKHIARASRLQLRLAELDSKNVALEATLDTVRYGLAMVDGLGRVSAMNVAFRRLCRAANGFRMARGRLEAIDEAEQAKLIGLVARAVQTARTGIGEGGGSMIVGTGTSKHPLVVTVEPLAHRPGRLVSDRSPAALVIAVDPATQPVPPGRMLMDLYHLTGAEARLAVELARGLKIEEAAEQHNVRVSTVRSQLQAVFSKTGTQRQAELMSLVTKIASATTDESGS